MGVTGLFRLAANAQRGTTAKKLIAQAVGAAYGKTEPPADLRMMWYCQRWGAMPEAGGVHDQSDTKMHRMAVLDNVYRAVYKKQNITNPHDIHKLTESDRRILRWLIDEGIITF